MSLFVLPFPVVDPVAIELGPIEVRWYGLAYMAGLLLGWLYVRSLLRNTALWPGSKPIADQNIADDLLLWATFGVVVGGRLGSVLFYEPSFYFANPVEILKIWNGGMSFHGGLIGVVLVIILFARAKKLPQFSVGDLVCAAVPIGLFFGRLANFVNQEVYGRVTDVSWAMIFPAVDDQPRHPSQLYEAVLEGLVLFLVCRYVTHYRNGFSKPGLVSGVFLAGYGIARIVAENFRQYDPDHAFSTGIMTPGIAYSIPMVLVGGYLIWMASSRRPATT